MFLKSLFYYCGELRQTESAQHKKGAGKLRITTEESKATDAQSKSLQHLSQETGLSA